MSQSVEVKSMIKTAFINIFFVPAKQVFYTGWWVYIHYRINDRNTKIQICFSPKDKKTWELLDEILILAGKSKIDTFRKLGKDLRDICKERKNYNSRLPNTWIKCKIKCSDSTGIIESIKELK